MPDPHPLRLGVDLRPRSAAEAYVAVADVAQRLADARHPYAPFAAVYARVTLEVTRAVEARAFEDPAWVSALAGHFAELYLEALDDHLGGRLTRLDAWARAFAAARRAPPSVVALLGVNAHINADLGLALATARLAASDAEDARHARDHERVNELLARVTPELLDLLTGEFRCRLAAFAAGPQRAWVARATMFVIRRWRARAWRDATALVEASQNGRYRQLVQMDRRATRLAHLLALLGAAAPAPVVVSPAR